MATITEDYVSFEIAKLLKEKGFTEKCIAYYSQSITPIKLTFGGKMNYNAPNKFKMQPPVSAPTLQMAMKWLREVHKLHITILWDCGAYIGKDSFCYHIDRINNYEDKGYNKIRFDSNEEACEAAIKYCLEHLI